MEKLRVFEAFAGYGSQHLALKRLKRDYPSFDFEVVGISEIERVEKMMREEAENQQTKLL